MTTMDKKQPFTLSELITPEDVREMAVIGHDAFLDDTHTNLKKYLVPEQPESVDGSGIREWLDMPERCHVIKAVHNKTLEIMGYICWAHRGYIPRPPQPETTKGRVSDLKEPNEQPTKIQQMEDMEDEHFTTFMADIMPEGTKCWFVAGLTVAPKFHRMGVARALLRWGTQRADADDVFAWVHSSELAWKAYAACGFEIVRALKIDLDNYAEGKAVGEGPGARGKWGAYTIRYMVYKPHRVGDDGWEVKSYDEVEAMPLS